MTIRKSARTFAVFVVTLVAAFVGSSALRAQRDPAEPPQAKPAPKLLPRPAATISRPDVDEAGMRSLIEQLVACGTRNSLSSWTDPMHSYGVGRVPERVCRTGHSCGIAS